MDSQRTRCQVRLFEKPHSSAAREIRVPEPRAKAENPLDLFREVAGAQPQTI